jgi:hypothetical protein
MTSQASAARWKPPAAATEGDIVRYLLTDPNIEAPDEFYAELLALHAGRSRDESERINARLILLLANHIGDPKILREALAAARLPEKE